MTVTLFILFLFIAYGYPDKFFQPNLNETIAP